MGTRCKHLFFELAIDVGQWKSLLYNILFMRENKNGPTPFPRSIQSIYTGTSKLYKRYLRTSQHCIDHDSGYKTAQITKGGLRLK